ncbi:plasmid mobilization protein [Aliarcobacter butzleri]|uniref:plasmid mobilization protein n=1 Tax=Aliarcobacter butzleri TaxID=28197 RepID=UPI003AF676CF
MKDKEFKFRLSDELFKILNIKSSSANTTNSDYIRSLIIRNEVKYNNNKNILNLIASINKIGNNVNQIAKGLNYAKKTKTIKDFDFAKMQENLLIIEFYLSEILDRNS